MKQKDYRIDYKQNRYSTLDKIYTVSIALIQSTIALDSSDAIMILIMIFMYSIMIIIDNNVYR